MPSTNIIQSNNEEKESQEEEENKMWMHADLFVRKYQ